MFRPGRGHGAGVFARAIALGELKYARTISADGHERQVAPFWQGGRHAQVHPRPMQVQVSLPVAGVEGGLKSNCDRIFRSGRIFK